MFDNLERHTDCLDGYWSSLAEMDLIVLIGIATALLVALISLYFLQKGSKSGDEKGMCIE